MPYCLHISRLTEDPDEDLTPIPLEEWRAAVAVTEGVRVFTGKSHIATLPTTGQVIKVSANEGDAEVFFPSDDRWYLVFTWFEGSASFAARLDPADASNRVWAVAASLATRLGAVIRGDEGELYDLRTGRVMGT